MSSKRGYDLVYKIDTMTSVIQSVYTSNYIFIRHFVMQSIIKSLVYIDNDVVTI